MLQQLTTTDAAEGEGKGNLEREYLRQSSDQIGNDIRALRQGRNWTLADLARRLDRSVGWLSQVERGTSEPTLADIRLIAELFSLPVSFFFSHTPPSDEQAYVVRAESRRMMRDDATQLSEELLSPDLGGSFELVRSVFAAGSSSAGSVQRPTEEAGYIIRGRLTITIDGRSFDLGPGDSFSFAGEVMSWENTGTEDAEVIWVIAPPIY
ncbi:MAG: helix-turn-helix transcriptional regulator [Alphaproteobacteria bacterium]|nr:helix-turn-helix transcriptional regulator [Alphaproteobacteria bacterium]